MFGPTFEVGDKVVWDNEARPGQPVSIRKEMGPFIVITTEDNDDADACNCGASRENGYDHSLFYENEGDLCAETPVQYVTVQQENGEVLNDHKGRPSRYGSSWFKKV